MPIYKDLDETLFREFKSVAKEGLNDLSADEEEREKIEFNVSQSRGPVDLRVDYSNFNNHIFFGSAYAAVNFALSRLINDYPWNGELKDKNEWHRVNSGFENYFFDTFPKQQGYAFFVTGSSTDSWIEINDYEKVLNPLTSSFTVEFALNPHDDLNGGEDREYLFSYSGSSDGIGIYLSSSKEIYFELVSGSIVEALSSSITSSISASHYMSFVFDKNDNKQIVYLDDAQFASRSIDNTFKTIDISDTAIAVIGALSSSGPSFYSGALDDFRFWHKARSPELIKRNFFKPVHANVSGGLKLYYKFNETSATNSNVIDYSGNDLHGTFAGTFVYADNIISGTLGSWFKDSGDLILDLANTRVSASLADWRSSGSYYDKENRNFVYKLVPSFFIEEGDDHEEMQRFLLLLARNYDRLKLYIQHLANIYNINQSEYNNTPNEFLSLVAKHYGLDLGGIYEDSSLLEFYYGENVLSTGSLDTSVSAIRNQLRRNLLSNLIYIIKTKSTKEALGASLRSLGLDEDIVNINEYSEFSGGVTTTDTFKTVERRVARLTGSNIFITSSIYSDSSDRTYQVRALFNTASVDTTSSVFTINSGSSPLIALWTERNSATSSLGKVVGYYTQTQISASNLQLYNNKWISFTLRVPYAAGNFSLNVGSVYGDEVDFHASASSVVNPTPVALSDFSDIFTASLGTTGSNYFDGWMQEFRAWNKSLTSAGTIDKHIKDFDALTLEDFNNEVQSLLLSHLKLNDFTGSSTGTGPIHDYSGNSFSGTYSGFSSSAEFNFPGKYIDKLEQSYSYDFAIDNTKVRIKDQDRFDLNQYTKDIPYLSVDISPVSSLNKEIIKWFGNLENFNNIVGYPYMKYRETVDTLNDYRYNFFKNKLNSKINFKAYLNLIKWFDSNFTFFLSQLIPLDIISSLSNFVIEPHLFEYNKIVHVFPFKKSFSKQYEGSISASVQTSVALVGQDIALADPGRYGAVVQISGAVGDDIRFDITSSRDESVNFRRQNVRDEITDFFQENSSSLAPVGYGNGWYVTTITGSEYLKNTYNVDTYFRISGVNYYGDVTADSQYLTSTYEPKNLHYTGTINGVCDQRWLWSITAIIDEARTNHTPPYDFGIKYGGAFGQLNFSNKAKRGMSITPEQPAARIDIATTPLLGVGKGTFVTPPQEENYIQIIEEDENTKTIIFWPTLDSYDGITINEYDFSTNNGTGSYNNILASHVGERINIEGYRHFEGNIIVQNLGNYVGDVFIKLRYQFFDSDNPGDIFENILSSSLDTGGYRTRTVSHEFIYNGTLSTSAFGQSLPSFVIDFARELPRKKFMAIYILLTSDDSQSPGVVVAPIRVLFRGKLHKDVTTVQDRILHFRRTS